MNLGLVIIGDELLTGKRQDAHLGYLLEQIQPRGLVLRWVRMVGDEEELLVEQFRQTLESTELVLCVGGIGTTPDDRTRQALAIAAGVPLVRHPEAVQAIEQRFGAEAYPTRIRMAELPQGSTIIPNPINQIPGFRWKNHCCLPGFPTMAWPMIVWVLDREWSVPLPLFVEQRLWVMGVGESQLVEILQQIVAQWPTLSVASLPHIGSDPHVELSVRGRSLLLVQQAFDALSALLVQHAIPFHLHGSKGE